MRLDGLEYVVIDESIREDSRVLSVNRNYNF